jgi:RNA polymerase sigma factor (sigma-70 family)
VRYAWGLVGNETDAEDVVQDAACGSLRADPKVSDEKGVDAYMRVAIRSNSRSLVRRRRRHDQRRNESRPVEVLESLEKSLVEVAIDLETKREDEGLLERVFEHLGRLPAQLRQVVDLLVLREPPMTLKEVAEMQGISIAGVHYRLERALQLLRTLDDSLREQGPEDDGAGHPS